MNTAPAPVVPIQEDHRAAREHLERFLTAVGGLALHRGAVPLSVITAELAWFEREFAAHMRREDRDVLPVLDQAMGQWCALPAWMRREHDELRRKLREVRAVVDALGTDDPSGVAALRRQADAFAGLLRIHIHREDAWLFPIAAVVLSPEQWAALGEARA